MSSAVRSFYAGRSVFISGGSGFLGKQVVEKLLRSCSDIERIYVLIRPKKNMTSQQRIEKITRLPLFARMNREQPNIFRKVVGICGDIELPGLGISDADHQALTSNVSVVIHSAANVKFNQSLRSAINSNVFGTRRVMELTKSLLKPEAFVTLSTAYSNSDKSFIEEKVYDPPMELEQVNSLLNILTDEPLELITPSLVGGLQNTYVYSKAIVEKVVQNEIGSIPCAILRPSVIVATVREPFEGWVDNSLAVNGFYSSIGSGMIRSFITGYRPTKMDIIPVDLLANAVIAAAWKLSIDRRPNEKNGAKSVVYNMITGDVNAITNTEAFTLMVQFTNMYPLRNRLRKAAYFSTTENKNRLRVKFDDYIELPFRCVLADLWSRVLGQQPRTMKTLKFYCKLRDVVKIYTSGELTWATKNLNDLENNLSSVDRQEFSLDRSFDWKAYFRSFWLGTKEYFFKETTHSSGNTKQVSISSKKRQNMM